MGSIQEELTETLALAERVAPDLVVEVLVTIAKDLKLSGKYGEAEKLYRTALTRLGESEEAFDCGLVVMFELATVSLDESDMKKP